MWQDWVNAVLGLAVIGVAFVGITGSTLMWSLFVLGALVVIVSVWGALVTSESMPRHA